MENQPEINNKPSRGNIWFWLILGSIILFIVYNITAFIRQRRSTARQSQSQVKSADTKNQPQLDLAAYDKKLQEIANTSQQTATNTASSTPSPLWPVKTAHPNYGALLPFNRIVAYYGNLYSRYMGVLGEYPEDIMLDKLNGEVKKWQAADPNTPVIPALHYIAVVAQAGPGRDGKYRARMPETEINKVLDMAKKINGIVFLDVQVGLSNVEAEIPPLEKYLKLPNVHLGIDPEFSMKDGSRPGTVIGTLDAQDINYTAEYLSRIVRQNNLPPKILVIHRFTRKMVTNYEHIVPLPETQIVMDMDGFGHRAVKLNTYRQYIYKEPVQFTGFKLFYKNDSAAGGMLEPESLLKLTPVPVYIQYQ